MASIINATTTNGVAISADNSGILQLATNSGTTAVTIDASQNVLIGASSLPTNATGLYVSSTVSSVSYRIRSGVSGSFGTSGYNFFWTGSALQAWIDGSNVGNVTLVSDYRIKQNIETNTTPALERIEQLRPVTYEFADYKELYKADGVAREGFIAHELQAIIPSAVEGEKDAENQIQSLKLDALCSVMVKAIQELKAIIDLQATCISALEAK